MSALPSPADAGQEAETAAASPIRRMSLWPPPRSARHNVRRRRLPLMILALLAAVGAGIGVYHWSGWSESRAVGEGSEDSAGRYTGAWSGEMIQVDEADEHVADWEASIELDERAEEGRAHWQPFDCRGDLFLLSATAERAVLEYAATHDPEGRCVEHARLTLMPGDSEEELRAQWVAISSEGTEMTSTGTMR